MSKDFDKIDMGLEFGSDEYFPFDDKYLEGMSGDDLGMPKDMPDKKGVKAFFKNVAKSTKGLTLDIARANVPNMMDFGTSLKDTAKLSRDGIIEARMKASEAAGKIMGQKSGQGNADIKGTIKSLRSKVKTSVSDIGSRLKSGEFYKTDEENMEMGDMFGDGGDFGGGGASESFGDSTTIESQPTTQLSSEPFGDTTTSSTSTTIGKRKRGSNRVAYINTGGGKGNIAATLAAAESSNKVSADIGVATIASMNQIFAKQFEADESRFRTHMNYQQNIATGVGIIAKYVNEIGTRSTSADMEYKTKMFALAQDNALLMKDIKQALYYTSPQYSQYQQSKTSKILGGGGGLNAEEYYKNIKGNLGNALGGTSLGTMAEMGGMYSDMKGSMNDMGMKQKMDPMSMLLRMGTNAMLSKNTKMKMGNLNDIFANAGGLLVGKMNQISRFSKNPIVSGLASMLGVKDSYVRKSDLGLKDPDGKAIFDMKTHRTINDVIPGYLAKILAATSGQEESFYDYKSGNFRTVTSLKKQMDRNVDRAYNSNYDLNKMTGAMIGDAVKNDKDMSNIPPAEVEKDFKQIMKNIVDSNMTFDQDTVSRIFNDVKFTKQLAEGTKHGLMSVKSFKNKYLKMNAEEQLLFNSQIVSTQGKVRDAGISNDNELIKFGGASAYAGVAAGKEREALQKALKYSGSLDSSRYGAGTRMETKTWQEQKNIMEQLEHLDDSGVGYMKGAVNHETGEANTSTTAGIWHNIYDLLIKGIIVYPKAVTTLPAHLAKLGAARDLEKQDAIQRRAAQAAEEDARSAEIKDLNGRMSKRQSQYKRMGNLGIMDTLGLRAQHAQSTNAFNQGMNSATNAATGLAASFMNGRNAKYGQGYGIMDSAYDETANLFTDSARSDMSMLKYFKKGAGSGGIKGAIGGAAGSIDNWIENKRKSAKRPSQGVKLNPDGSLKYSDPFHRSIDQKKKQLKDYMASKGVFEKVNKTTRDLFSTVDALSEPEIDAIIAKQQAEDLKEYATSHPPVKEHAPEAFNSAGMSTPSTSMINSSIRKTKKVYNTTKIDNGGVVSAISTTNDLLARSLEKSFTFDSTGINDRLDVVSTQIAAIIALMGTSEKDMTTVSNTMAEKVGKIKEKGKGFFKRTFMGFRTATKKITDKLKRTDSDGEKKQGLIGKLFGFGRSVIGGAAGAAGSIGAGLVGFGKRVLVGGGKKVEEAKLLLKEIQHSAKLLEKDTKGMTFSQRKKYIEGKVKEGLISSRAAEFIMEKLKIANKNKLDLDAVTSNLGSSAKEKLDMVKGKSKGAIAGAFEGLKKIFSGAGAAAAGAGGIAGAVVGLAGKAIVAIKNFLFGSTDKIKEAKELAKEIHDAIKAMGDDMQGMTFAQRKKYIEDKIAECTISERAGAFIIAKLKVANNHKVDLDAVLTGLGANAKRIVDEAKHNSRGMLQRASSTLQGLFKKKPETVSLDGGKKGLLGGIGAIFKGFGDKIGGLFGKKKSNDSDDRREGSEKDYLLDKLEANREKRADEMLITVKRILKQTEKISGGGTAKKSKTNFLAGFGISNASAGVEDGEGGGKGDGGGSGNPLIDAVGDAVTDKITDKVTGVIMKKVGGKGAGKILGRILGKGAGKGLAEGAAKFGGKGLAKVGLKAGVKGLAKFAGPAGIALTVADAAYGGYKGWNDAANIAGLEEGQQATTGQKIGAAASGAVSNLSFGLLSSKSIYGAGKKFGNYLVGDKQDKDGNMVKRSLSEKAMRIGMMANPLTAGGMFAYDAIKNSNFMKGASKKIMALPVIGKISSFFGARSDPFSGQPSVHNGLDIAAKVGSPIKAIQDGVVHKCGENHPVLGKYIVLKHANNTFTVHGHASKLYVKKGDRVTQGQEIAAVGNSGESTGPHIHFSVIKDGKLIDPQSFIASNGKNTSNSAPVTSFYTALTGVSGAGTGKAKKEEKPDNTPVNPNATSPEEVPSSTGDVRAAPTASVASADASYSPAMKAAMSEHKSFYKSGVNDPNYVDPVVARRNSAAMKESSVITNAKLGQGGSEDVNKTLEVMRVLYMEEARHNRVAENFYHVMQSMIAEMSERDLKVFGDHNKMMEKSKRAERENNLYASKNQVSPASRNNNSYDVTGNDSIATGY